MNTSRPRVWRLAAKWAISLATPPVNDDRFAKPSEHDVFRLQVTMHDAAAVRVSNRIASVDEAAQQSPESQFPAQQALVEYLQAQVRETGRSPA